MSNRRLYDQVMTIFGTMMILFYFGLAYAIIFSSIFSTTDITLRVIFSVPLILYGSFRAVQSFQKIRENFFEADSD